MNWDIVQGNWKQLKGKVREEWGDLTNDEIDEINGQREQLIGKLQEKYGIARDIAEQKADKFAEGLQEMAGASSKPRPPQP
jgi:uncharacterized protein YjbJ (UPF0337 family)